MPLQPRKLRLWTQASCSMEQVEAPPSRAGLQLPKLWLCIRASLCSWRRPGAGRICPPGCSCSPHDQQLQTWAQLHGAGRSWEQAGSPSWQGGSSQVQLWPPSQTQDLGISAACTLGWPGSPPPHNPCRLRSVCSHCLTSLLSQHLLRSLQVGLGRIPGPRMAAGVREFAGQKGVGSPVRHHLQVMEGLKAESQVTSPTHQSRDSLLPMATHGPICMHFLPYEIHKSRGLSHRTREDGQSRIEDAEDRDEGMTSCREELPSADSLRGLHRPENNLPAEKSHPLQGLLSAESSRQWDEQWAERSHPLQGLFCAES